MRLIRFLKLVLAFQARVRLVGSLFRVHRGLEDMTDWRREGLPRTGFIDEAKTLSYQFHGIGCRADTPEGPIDWDFNKYGRMDGVDLWRLSKFVQENPGLFPEFQNYANLTQAFEAAVERGILQPDQDDPTSTLYFLDKSVADSIG